MDSQGGVRPMSENGKRERSHYAPYDTMPAFDEGLSAYGRLVEAKFASSIPNPYDLNSVEAQAWDRGYEYGSYLHWRKRRTTETD
jgi:hypothetical protein